MRTLFLFLLAVAFRGTVELGLHIGGCGRGGSSDTLGTASLIGNHFLLLTPLALSI